MSLEMNGGCWLSNWERWQIAFTMILLFILGFMCGRTK